MIEIVKPLFSILFFLFILICPFLPLYFRSQMNHKYRILLYVIIGLILGVVFVFIFSWWNDYSNKLLMTFYGYNFDSMNDYEKYLNVKKENRDNVIQIEKTLMGIGWPLKAGIMYIFYLLYFFLIYLFRLIK